MKNLSIPIRFGLVTSVILIAYFLVLALFNKHINPAFSFFNAVITDLNNASTAVFSRKSNEWYFL